MKLAQSSSELMGFVETANYRAVAVPAFQPGDTVRLHLKVTEGDKERIQIYEGVVIGRRGGGTREMIVVRKISFGIGVERIFPLHSPFVTRIEVVRKGKVRRAKLYFLREKTGKHAKLKQEFQEAMPAMAAETPAVEAEKPTEEAMAAAKEKKAARKEKKAAKKAKK